jgi:hypothetical protein
MDLGELANRIDARLISPLPGAVQEVNAIHAADTISGLIANASHETLLVTSLNNNQLIRVAELMDAPGLCLVGGAQPSPELIARAREAGASILISPHPLQETRDLLEACIEAAKRVRA